MVRFAKVRICYDDQSLFCPCSIESSQQTRNVAGTWQERSKVAGRLRYFGMFLPRSCHVPIRRHSETFVQCSCHVPRDISATFNNNVILWRSYHFPATFKMNVVFGMFLSRSRHIHIERGFGTFQPRSRHIPKKFSSDVPECPWLFNVSVTFLPRPDWMWS